MDVDNENFYDEIASFMPSPGNYSLEDLDEIIRSTDSHLDASLDINAFSNALDQNDFDMNVANADTFVNYQLSSTLQEPQRLSLKNEKQTNNGNEVFDFNFSAFPSPASSLYSADYSPPHITPPRTSSPISLEDVHFNPDDFINFLNDDNIKIDDLTTNSISRLIDDNRNTPSPTGSCTSSSGSSTSGIQSDASSESQNYKTNDELLEFIKFKNEKIDIDFETSNNTYKNNAQFDSNSVVIKEEDEVVDNSATNLLPIKVPLLTMNTMQNALPVNFVQGTIIPVQTVPLTNVHKVVNIKAPSAIKMASQNVTKSLAAQSLNLVNVSSNDASPKIATPLNTKPKTIYLSSNDFKALMNKMNTNGKKITGTNGQIPKIIMKTASGKVIAGNKLDDTCRGTSTPAVSSVTAKKSSITASQPLHFMSKNLTQSESIVVKQQKPSKFVTSNVRSAGVMAAARATLGHTKLDRNNLTMLKGLNDEKLLKKQLRMLKNRESASLSRKKKKEYIEKLENRISDLEKKNYSLKGENNSLRAQLMAFAQTCNCKHGNVSEFILNTLNMDGKNGESVLNTIDASYLLNNAKQHLESCHTEGNSNLNNSTHHVKIAPKPPNAGPFINKGFKQRLSTATVKKNVAILFAMAFMVTLNVGNFQNYLNKSTLENAIETSVIGANEEQVVQTGRRLLWVPNEHELHEQSNRSKRDTEKANMSPPPLHFLRPINRTTGDKMNGTSAKDEPPIKRSAATYANATLENMRLARNLHKWIGGNNYLNLTGTTTDNDIEQMKHFKFGSGSYMNYDLTLQAPIGMKQKRKIIFEAQTQEKHAKLNIKDEHNSLDIFKSRISEEYLRLFKGIKRQDDTFYVLSFNMDHILLPASAYNKSSRPKMSLMLPAGDPLNNGDMVLMQIDCEVINTTELEIKSHMIPKKLRPAKFSANVRVNPHGVANNETSARQHTAATTNSNDTSAKKQSESFEKPAPRTYFMMGPKNQASFHTANLVGHGVNVVKRKPTIVKLNATDSVIGSGILNVRNSSLFSRMRETVGSHGNGGLSPTDVKKFS